MDQLSHHGKLCFFSPFPFCSSLFWFKLSSQIRCYIVNWPFCFLFLIILLALLIIRVVLFLGYNKLFIFTRVIIIWSLLLLGGLCNCLIFAVMSAILFKIKVLFYLLSFLHWWLLLFLVMLVTGCPWELVYNKCTWYRIKVCSRITSLL